MRKLGKTTEPNKRIALPGRGEDIHIFDVGKRGNKPEEKTCEKEDEVGQML